MGTCGCKWCPKKVESPVKFIATIGAAQGTDVAPESAAAGCSALRAPKGGADAIEIHTRKCAVDSARKRVIIAFGEYLNLEPGDWELIEELKAKIISAS